MGVTTSSFSICAARTNADYQVAGELFRQYADWLKVDASFPDLDQEIEELSTRYGPPTGDVFLAMSDQGDCLGCIALRSLLIPGACELKRLYVLPEARGDGVGRALLKRALRFADCAGYDQIFLDTLPGMTTAIKMYGSLGFRETSAYYSSPVVGALYFLKELTSETAAEAVR